MNEEPRTSVEELPRLSLKGIRARWKRRGARNRSMGAATPESGIELVGDAHIRAADGTWVHGSPHGGGSGGGGL